MSDEVREIETTDIVTADYDEVTAYAAPRGAWDFTGPQRIAIAILVWLNIMVFIVGYLALTGQISL